MLSRVASITRKATRRYTTNGSGGSTGGSEAGAKSKTASSSGSPAKLGMTWLEKKAELDRGSFGTKLACAVVLAVSAATIYEQQKKGVSNKEMLETIEALNTNPLSDRAFAQDPKLQSRRINVGFDDLPDLLAIRRRSFSGDVVTPVSPELLASYEKKLVDALLSASYDPFENRWRALTMLGTLAKSSASVRQRLRDPDALHLLMEHGTMFSLNSSPRHEWLLAADLVLQVLSDPEASSVLESQENVVKKFHAAYAKSNNPVAMIVLSRLSELTKLPGPSTDFSKETENAMLAQALLESNATDYSKAVSGASLISSLGFAVFGGIWGRIRWAFRLTSKGAFNAQAWSWSAKKHIARPLALWFMLDMLGQRLLTFASSDKFEFDEKALNEIANVEARANLSGMTFSDGLKQASSFLSKIPGTQGVSLASALSLAQNCSFTLFSLWMISTRRYAFLPLAAAGIYNHYDQISKIPQVKYVVTTGHLNADEIDIKRYLRNRTL